MRRPLLAAGLAVLVLSLAAPAGTHAQAPDTTGQSTAHLTGWPDEAADGDWYDRLRRADLVAFIDTLTVDYTWRVAGDVPFVEVTVRWTPGPGGVLDGRRVKAELLPPDVRLAALALDADVTSGGAVIGGLAIELDSLALAPSPDAYAFATGPLTWEGLFAGATAEAARAAFAEGFALTNLRIRTVAFVADGEGADGPYTVVTERERARRVGIYTHEPPIFVDVRLGWLLGRPSRPPVRAGRPRGEAISRGGALQDERTRGGRAAAEPPADRSADRSADRAADSAGSDDAEVGQRGSRGGRLTGLLGGRDRAGKASDDDEEGEDDEDDDETNELLPGGLVAVAAVGVLAYHAGTVGYFGHTRHAPYGLAAGYVRAHGGVLVHAGTSEAVLTSGDGARHALGGFVVFRDVLGLPIQPALGLGLLATDRGTTVRLEPALSFGMALNAGPVLGLATWDAVHGGLGLGAAVNFRSSAFR